MYGFMLIVGAWFLTLSAASPISTRINNPSAVTNSLRNTTTSGHSSQIPTERSSTSTLLVTNDGRQVIRSDASRRLRQGKLAKPAQVNMFREVVEDYPEDEIKTILKQVPESLRNLYNVINTDLDPNVNLTERVASKSYDSIEDESGIQEEPVCRTITRNIYPREAVLQNSLVYIPNTDDFMQVIQVEYCQNPNDECGNYLRDSLPYGMTSICHQKYSYKKLLYIDRDKRASTDRFRYPSCCTCYIRTLPLDLRSGSAKANNTSSSPTRNATEIIVKHREASLKIDPK